MVDTITIKKQSLLPDLEGYQNIFVTGPQRSGTTICARIIEADYGYTYVDEEDFGIHEKSDLLEYIGNRKGLVIQCPGLSRWIDEIASDNDLVIWMLRDTSEIIESQKRIRWDNTKEKGKYSDYTKSVPIAIVKNLHWNNVQKKKIKHVLEVDYSSLAKHELFIPARSRKGFGNRQWKG